MTEAQSPQDKQSAVIDAARLIEVTLTATHFAVSPDFKDEQDSSDKFLDEDVLESHYDADSSLLLGHVQCKVWMNRASDNTLEKKPSVDEAIAQSLFSVTAEYFVAFNVGGEHDEDSIRAFFKRTAPFSAWPYFRALVSQLAASAGLSIPILPIKRVLVPFKAEGGYVRAKAAETETVDH